MICFVKLNTRITNFDEWRNGTQHLTLKDRMNSDTGEIILSYHPNDLRSQHTRIRDGQYGGYEYRLVTSEKKWNFGSCSTTQDHYLHIMGSLHKNHFGGENYSSFGWSALQSEISRISSTFCINEDEASMTKMEIGVNIELPFTPYDFLRESLIAYKGEPFSRYKPDRHGTILGYECGLKDYTVKAYDKGLQYKLQKNLFRFELSYKNMIHLRREGIYKLSDLRDPEKVSILSKRLFKGWEDVMLCNMPDNIENLDLSIRDNKLLYDGGNPKYWERLKHQNKNSYHYLRRKYKKLITEYGQDQHGLIQKLLVAEWSRLMHL